MPQSIPSTPTARTVDELTEAERIAAIQAFKATHGAAPDLRSASDRSWIEGFTVGAALKAGAQP